MIRFDTLLRLRLRLGFQNPTWIRQLTRLKMPAAFLCTSSTCTQLSGKSDRYKSRNVTCKQTKVVNKSYNTKSSLSDVVNAATKRGYELRNKSVWPLLNLSMYVNDEDGAKSKYIGGINGAILPTNRLHIESYKAERSIREKKGSLLSLSPGMILFIGALAYGQQHGAKHVYGLAINDAPDQHKRLLRYLKKFGGMEVKRVTDSLADVPARMFYGGFGTIIKGDVDSMLQRGMGMLERSKAVVHQTKSEEL